MLGRKSIVVGGVAALCVALLLSIGLRANGGRPRVSLAEASQPQSKPQFKPLVVQPVKYLLDQQRRHVDEMSKRAAQIQSESDRSAMLDRVEAHAERARSVLDALEQVDGIQAKLAASETPDASDADGIAQAIEQVEELIVEEQVIEKAMSDKGAPQPEEPSFWDHVLKVLKFLLEVILFVFKILAAIGGGGSDGGSTGTTGSDSGLGSGGYIGGEATLAVALDAGDEHYVRAEGRQLTVVPDHDLNRIRTVSLPTQLARAGVTLRGVDCQPDGATVLTCIPNDGELVRIRYAAADDQPQVLVGTLHD